MHYYAARRIADGLLFPCRCPKPPSNLIARAIAGYGGTAPDWEQITMTAADGKAALDALPAQPYWSNGAVIGKLIELSSDQADITANGIDTATLTADTGDPAFTGNVIFRVTSPDGSITTSTIAAISGVATETLTTQQVETHIVQAEAVGFGYSEITIEGV